MKKALFLALALLFVAGTAMAVGLVSGSKHNLSLSGTGNVKSSNETQVCVFCHTPHNAYVNPLGTAANTYPLWNHQLSTVASYGIYLSDTMNVTPSAWGGGTQAKSALCMSCHDGTVGLNVLYNYSSLGTPAGLASIAGFTNASAQLISSANIGTNLSNDHPVNFNYNAALVALDGGLFTPTSLNAVNNNIPLFGGTGQLQCASCHDAHDGTNIPFLRVSSTASNLCLNCHNK